MRPPDFVVHNAFGPYLNRWHLIPRNRWLNVYLHRFDGSDEDRALHDHPWASLSLMLKGALIEVTHNDRKLIRAGALRLRGPKFAHRLEHVGITTWTLFITGPRVRDWGFHCPNGWKHWRDFTDARDTGKVGRGCE